ncbi:hypothetical protein F5Y18DRAFT_437130 [Xylariaceae sp. FL1019]|nr:hypothetical protein F5Y18DRAFT_437130 [Xylariaceae sp. FL1019]
MTRQDVVIFHHNAKTYDTHILNHNAKTYDTQSPSPSYNINSTRRKTKKKHPYPSPNARHACGNIETGATGGLLSAADADRRHGGFASKRLEINSNDSDSSKPASVFDDDERGLGNARQRSISSARSAFTEDSYQGDRVPCEFGWLADCETHHFMLHQKSTWIEHTESHLRGAFPALSHCWFCNGLEFRAEDSSGPSCKRAFERRLSHIWEHFTRNRSLTQPIRPDSSLLDHLESHHLISEEKLEACRNLSQLIVKDIFPPEFELLKPYRDELRPENNAPVRRERGRGRSNSPQTGVTAKPRRARSRQNYRQALVKLYLDTLDAGGTESEGIGDPAPKQTFITAIETESSMRSMSKTASDVPTKRGGKPKSVSFDRKGFLATFAHHMSVALSQFMSRCRRLLWPRLTQGMRCGQPLYIDAPESCQQAAVDFAQDASDKTNTIQVSRSASSPNRDYSAFPSPLTRASTSVTSSSDPPSPLQARTGSTFRAPDLAAGTKKYLLLCVNTATYQIQLAQIDVTDVLDDALLYSHIRRTYSDMRGSLRNNRLVSPKTIEYIKFELVHRNRTGECVGNYQKDSIPGLDEVMRKEYTFRPCPPRIGALPIQPHLFMHSFHNQGDHLGGLTVQQLPKKVGRRLKCTSQPRDPLDIPYGWGIYIVEGLNTFFASLLLAGILVVTTLIVSLWSVLKADVQGGTGIGQYALAVVGTGVAIGALMWKPLRDLS